MKIAQAFDLEIISIRHITVTKDHGLTGPQYPAYEIFGKLSTQCQYAYFPNPVQRDLKEITKSWHFSALMIDHPEIGHYFASVGPLDSQTSDLIREIVAEHLRNMDLSGALELDPSFKTERKKLLQESYE